MQRTNRTIVRISRLFAVAALVAALSPGAAAAEAPAHLKGAKTFVLPSQTYSDSVAISPTGVPWFGAGAPDMLSLFSVEAESMKVVDLDPHHKLVTGDDYGKTDHLRFDGDGNLWFVRDDSAGGAVVRRTPDGTETAFALPPGPPVSSLAIRPEGQVWLTRGHRRAAELVSVTATGTMTRFPLAAGSYPTSIVAGPDGALWFTEEAAGDVGRIGPRGKIRLFALGPRVHPREIVAGPEGALWFSENGKRGRHGKSSDRIGRITTEGKITQFAIPFGHGTEQLAADPGGRVWFSTEKGEISSISLSGAIGARGCPGSCASAIYSLAVGPEGALWFAAEKHYVPCLQCGGGTAIQQQLEGAPVGEIPAGVLRPADSGSP